MHLYAVAVVVLVCFSCLVLARLMLREHSTNEFLLAQTRHDMLDRLLPFAYHSDKDTLLAAIGGIKGMWTIYRTFGAISTLIVRCAREQNEPTNGLIEQAFVYSMCGRLLTPMAIAEALLRKALPVWPPVFATAQAQIFCEMACTLEAIGIYA